jgi:DNA-binding transcriptional LysR family regulator
MDVRRLGILQALARYRTVRAAADALHLSPSSVSQQISVLEREAGVSLIEKEGRSVRLTSAAQVLIEHAHAIFAELESARSDLTACQDGTLGVTHAGGFASAIPALLAPAVARLHTEHPRWRVHLRQVEPEHSTDQLISGDLDLAITMAGPHLPRHDHPQIRLTHLLTEPYDAVLRTDDPLCRHEHVDIAGDLSHRPWVVSAPGTAWFDRVTAAAHTAGFQPRAVHHVDDFTAAIGLVRAGLAVALLPRSVWEGHSQADVTARPITGGPPTRHVFAAVRRGDQTPALLDTLEHVAHELAANLALPISPHSRALASDEHRTD